MAMDTERRTPRTVKTWAGLVVFGALAAAAALLGVLAVSGTEQEYAALQTPPWAPPSWVFGPVWSVLYLMIAVSGWLVWRDHGLQPAFWVYGAQLVLNALWTPLFFGMGQYGLAMLDIVLLWIVIRVNVTWFRKFSRPAAVLLLPYWLWVAFAGALNMSIWLANS